MAKNKMCLLRWIKKIFNRRKKMGELDTSWRD